MGKIIKFPTITEGDNIKKELKKHEEEIKSCLDDLQAMNDHIVELTIWDIISKTVWNISYRHGRLFRW